MKDKENINMLIITFHNDSTGTDEVANYNIQVYVNKNRIYMDRIVGHKREEGWEKLVKLLAKKL